MLLSHNLFNHQVIRRRGFTCKAGNLFFKFRNNAVGKLARLGKVPGPLRLGKFNPCLIKLFLKLVGIR